MITISTSLTSFNEDISVNITTVHLLMIIAHARHETLSINKPCRISAVFGSFRESFLCEIFQNQ